MASHSTAIRQDRDGFLSVVEALRRANLELSGVRAGMEHAFDIVHAHADPKSLNDPDYLVAMQSIDSLSQQVAAVERFLENIGAACGTDLAIDSHDAASGITLAAVARRLTEESGSHAQDSGECDFF
jgi:hypothetical protein